MSKNLDTKPPFDLTVEINNIKARLETLEQKLFTINHEKPSHTFDSGHTFVPRSKQ